MEGQPKDLKPEDVAFITKAAEALGEPNEMPGTPFEGAVMNGTWTAPYPDLTPAERIALDRALENIQKHRS